MKKELKDYTSFKLTEKSIIQEARLRCMKEMYAKAQPSANYDDILKYFTFLPDGVPLGRHSYPSRAAARR